jgi:hypothetical protein
MGGYLYLVARTAIAALLLVRQWRSGEGTWPALGQLLSDVCAALFLAGFVDPRFDNTLSGWWLPLFLYVLTWEGVRLRNLYDEMVDAPTTDDPAAVETLRAPLLWTWQIAGVLPPLAAGAVLVVNSSLSR